MSKRHLRKDPICQNCGKHVEERFCGHCGQENTETRQSFGHLLRHVVEDLTHYDGAFWRTMKYLLFRPAYLTKEFLKGRRISYVPPVRLYIFISFITFLLPYVLPKSAEESDGHAEEKTTTIRMADSLASDSSRQATAELDSSILRMPRTYQSLRQLDSAQSLLPESERMGRIERWLTERSIPLQKYGWKELDEKFIESFSHNFPKALFVYMPLFALVLWLFHGKKRWMYFDHAIFTLHYFSFVLLVFNVLTISDSIFSSSTVIGLLFLLFTVALFIYFFMAHRRMYEESRAISFIKSSIIYSVNLAIFILVVLIFILISVFSIH
jgi:hypothetical protein